MAPVALPEAALCRTCNLFLPVIWCPLCGDGSCERHAAAHGRKHVEAVHHAITAMGPQKAKELGLKL